MRLRLSVVPNAERQIREASRWWHRNRPAARDLFRAELSRAFDLVTLEPAIGSRAEDVEEPGVRRLYLSRIRYYLYYRVHVDLVEVLAIWHTSRGSSPQL